MNERYDLLKARYILDILIGDTTFGDVKTSENDCRSVICSLPYLTGSAICNIASRFGYSLSYTYGGALSRWAYMEKIVDWCIENNRISDLLKYLFSKERFTDKFIGCSADEADLLYNKIISIIMSKINGYLSCSGNELVVIGNIYHMKQQNVEIAIETPALNRIDREYVQQLVDRASNDIANGDYDSAVTKARTLIEEVFCYVIEQKGENPSDKGDINRLYNQVKNLYNMHQNGSLDRRVNDLLSGLNKIIDSISNMRNVTSDSHGLGARRVAIFDYHTRLIVGTAAVFSEFILSVVENAQ